MGRGYSKGKQKLLRVQVTGGKITVNVRSKSMEKLTLVKIRAKFESTVYFFSYTFFFGRITDTKLRSKLNAMNLLQISLYLDCTVFIRISAQPRIMRPPRISAHPKGRKS